MGEDKSDLPLRRVAAEFLGWCLETHGAETNAPYYKWSNRNGFITPSEYSVDDSLKHLPAFEYDHHLIPELISGIMTAGWDFKIETEQGYDAFRIQGVKDRFLRTTTMDTPAIDWLYAHSFPLLFCVFIEQMKTPSTWAGIQPSPY